MSAGPASVSAPVEHGLPEPSFRSILLACAPRFLREAFGPVAAFYVGWKLGNLVAGIVLASAVGIALDLYERRRGRAGALALVSVAFVVVQAVIGIIADSAVVYLAQPVLVSAIWGIANTSAPRSSVDPLRGSSPTPGIRSQGGKGVAHLPADLRHRVRRLGRLPAG